MCYGINDGCLALWVSPVLSFGTQKSGKLHQFMLTQVSDQFYIKFIQTKWIPEKPNLSLFWQQEESFIGEDSFAVLPVLCL